MKGPIYIAGPMTGYDENNFLFFEHVAKKLRSLAFEVLSPHEAEVGENPTWDHCMRVDLAMLLKANTVVTLPNWECSRGAKLEVHIAHALGITVLPSSYVLRFEGLPPV